MTTNPASLSSAEVASLTVHVQHFSRARILCVGDVMVDRFIEGSVKRISPESPVPVFMSGRRDMFPGGTANVARNVFALGASCTLLGAVGDDAAGRELTAAIEAGTTIRTDFLKLTDRPTTEKTRFVTQGHHMLRVDIESAEPIGSESEAEVLRRLERLIAAHDVVVLSDYAKGFLTNQVLAHAIAIAKAAGKPVIVDPKGTDFSKYSGATVVTPNAREVEAASNVEPATDSLAVAAGRIALDQAQSDAILITRGDKGMTLVPRDGAALQIPSAAREVYDVVGAGDTVVATLAVSLAIGAPLETAARLANAAGGIAVGKRGTGTVSANELIDGVTRHGAVPRRGAPVLLTAQQAARYARARKAEGQRVGFTNGVFDILHPGHIALLQFSRDACDCLIVGLNSDASVGRLKGPSRPVNGHDDRAIVLGALGTVSAVVIFESDTPIDLIAAIQPDVLIKGADYSVATVVGADLVTAYGGTVLLAPLVEGASSTNTITRARLAASA
jgi:D-beta-D-heptose 7-phosphate kinase/D-beta-D-heptose 1-phosphate adenosyltransferase